MWKAITYVSSGLTLVAFVAAVAAWVYRSKILERERLIRLAREKDRAKLVENTLQFFSVDTQSLKKDQQYDLAIQQIHAWAARFRTSAIVVVVIAFLTTTVAVFAIWKSANTSPPARSSFGDSPTPNPTVEKNSNSRGQIRELSTAVNQSAVNTHPSSSAPLTNASKTRAHRLAGMVVDETGQPLAGAQASLDDFPERPPVESATNGTFVLENIPKQLNDQVRLRVSLSGYGTKTRDVIIGRSSPRIVLEKAK